MAHWSCGVFVQLLWRTATSKEALNQICLNFAQIVSAVTKTLHLPHGKSEFARTSARFVPMVVRRYCTMYAANCGGGFVPRPIRPRTERRKELSIAHQPASSKRVHLKYIRAEIGEFASAVKDIAAHDR